MLGFQETIAFLKEYNLKLHYQSRHEVKYNSSRGEEQEDKIKQVTKLVHRQQTAITKVGGIDDCFQASFIVAQDIAKNMKSFEGGVLYKIAFYMQRNAFFLTVLMILKGLVFQETQSPEG